MLGSVSVSLCPMPGAAQFESQEDHSNDEDKDDDKDDDDNDDDNDDDDNDDTMTMVMRHPEAPEARLSKGGGGDARTY